MKLTSLFKDALESDDADTRARAVAELDASDARLAKLAVDDASAQVRVAAATRLADIDTLQRVASADSDAAVRAAAGERLVAVISGTADAAPDSRARLAWLRQHGDARLAAGVAAAGSEPDLRIAALERLQSIASDELEALCATRAVEDSAAQVRSWAVQRVRSAEALEQVLAAARGHDKRVVQLARAQLNALREAQARSAARERLCEQIETLAANPDGDSSLLVEVSLSARVQAIDNEWQQLAVQAHSADGLDGRFARALDAVRAIVAQRQGAQARQAALNESLSTLASRPSDDTVKAELDSLTAKWHALDGVTEADTRAFLKRASDIRKQHELALRDEDRSAVAERVLGPREQQLRDGKRIAPGALKSLEKAWARTTLPRHSDQAQALTGRYQAVHDALRDALKRQKGDAASAAGELNGLLDELEQRIEAGTLNEAESLYDKSRSRLQKALLEDARKATAEKRLQAAAARIAELKRWRHWSTDKARDSLIEAAEALIGKQGKIAVLAQDVRDLRERWKKLDHADGPARQELWNRFDEACEKAYAPCKAHFDEQSARRAENLQTREALCEEVRKLERDTDWTAPDWRALVKKHREITRAFFAAAPVDRKAKKSSEKAFRKAGESLDAHLEGEREKELVRRRGLIRKVEALAAEQDIRTAVAAAQDAQKQWSPTVQSERKVENALWREFRAACDAVFERRRETIEASKQEANAAEEARRAVCDAVLALEQELAALNPATADFETQLNQLAGRFKTATGEWQGAGRGQRSKVEPRYRDACRTFEKSMKGRRREARLRDRETLAQRAALCTSLEQAAICGEPSLTAEQAREKEEVWNALPESRGDVGKALARRFETALAACQADGDTAQQLTAALDDNFERKRRLCLELEIAADIDSPEELAEVRMKHRVQQLSAALSSGGADSSTTARPVRELADEWYVTGPVTDAEHEALEARFRRAMEAAGEPVA